MSNNVASLAGKITSKAVGATTGAAFTMEDITSPIIRKPVKPGLLSAILTPNNSFLQTGIFAYDAFESTYNIPAGKPITKHGTVETTKDYPTKKFFEVGSFELGYTLSPEDIHARRKMGTNELMDMADLVAMEEVKIQAAWEIHRELGLAQLLTTDTNYVAAGPYPVYDFYEDIEGSTRPPKIDMDLGNDTIDQFVNAAEQKELLEEELARYGLSADRIAIICGRTYFNSRLEIEKQEGIARELRGRDLVSEIVPEMSDGNFSYSMFESHDGLIYIKYSANIAGTKLIADADAYMVPLGVTEGIFTIAHRPAVTMSYVNTVALPMYTWAKEDEYNGLAVHTESNHTFLNLRPKAVRHLTTSTFL